MSQPQHTVSIGIEGKQIDGWTEYEIGSSMLDAVDHFTMKRPFQSDAHKLCKTDRKIRVRIDDTIVIDGLIDKREKDTDRDTNTTTIVGRDKVGRLVQESAPTISYESDLVAVVTKLVDPWFSRVVLSDARNRRVRTGRYGRKAAASDEELVIKLKAHTYEDEWGQKERYYNVEPGKAKWAIAHELVSEAGLMIWSSADGSEIVIGEPNYQQGIQFVIANPGNRSSTQPTALKLNFSEDLTDSYSLIMALGSGQGSAANYGESTVSRRDIVRNGPSPDGTGGDFLYPKRLILAERAVRNIAEARQTATREMNRRDFRKNVVTATMPTHGQVTGSSSRATLFAPNTMARVIDEEQDPPIDGSFLIVSCKYKSTREGETTELELVPKGTVFSQ